MRQAAALVLAACVLAAGPAHAGVSVEPDRASVRTTIGQKFTFHTTVKNSGPTTAADLIAHLNVLSLRNGTYVDPEDWSSHRTRYLPPLRAGGTLTLTWNLQAVNSGSFGVYVAALPASGTPNAPVVGPTVHVSVAARQTLNSAGILPLAVGLPAALGLLTATLRLRRRTR
jgi:hypothetical protein